MQNISRHILTILLLLIADNIFGQTWTSEDYASKHEEVLGQIRTNHTIRATKDVLQIEKHANSENNIFGHFVCYDIKGHLHQNNMESDEARNNYYDALKCCRRANDSIHIYEDLAENYRLSKDYDKAEKCLNTANSLIGKSRLMPRADFKTIENEYYIERCMLYYTTGNHLAFKSSYNKLKALSGHSSYQKDDICLLEVYDKMMDGNYEKALNTCIGYWPDSHYWVRSAIYEKMGKYLDATKAWNDNVCYNDTTTSKGQQYDINELSQELGNYRLLSENQLLARNNTSLQLNFANLELGKAQLALEETRQNSLLQEAKQRNDKLLIDKRNAELSVLKARSEKERTEREVNENKERRNSLIMIELFGVGMLVAIVLYITLRQAKIRNRKLTEKNEQLNQARMMAEESDRNKSSFLQHISHEVRTPLNAICGFAQLISSPDINNDEESLNEMKEFIHNGSATMKETLKDIMELAAIADGTISMDNDEVNINALGRELIDDVKSRCPQSVTLAFNTNVEDNFSFTADYKRVSHIINNLLTNSLKNTEEGSINLDIKNNETDITFTVTDTGCGIPTDKQEVIFEKFYKVDSFKQGFGLGLGISRDLARLMNGDLVLDKSYTQGARFIFTLNK